MAVDPVPLAAAALASPPRCGSVRVVAVDGGAAAGKSTLAAGLARLLPGSFVLHTDDLLDGWAAQFDFWPLLREQVLEPLAAGQPASFRRFDWTVGRFTETVAVGVPDTLVVEGVSAIQASADRLSLGIFLQVDRAERERRWRARDGPLQPEWRRWLDREDEFFARYPPGPPSLLVTDQASSKSTTSGR
jgi:hypothetical protein